jgi:glycine/sarcosine N-methyltransferase
MTDPGNRPDRRPGSRQDDRPVGRPGHRDDVRRFYDDLAPSYDRMTDFQGRLGRDTPLFEALVRKFSIRSALDAGCGTGFHSILLARVGVDVTAIDLSSEMVRRAAENAERAGVTIRAYQSSFSEIGGPAPAATGGTPPPARRPFDALFCLGNTLAHMEDDAALDESLGNFRKVLKPGGVLLVQVLNYEKILAERKEVLGVRKAGDSTFERRYSYGEGGVTFTVTTTGPGGSKADSVSLRPLIRPILLGSLLRCGYREITTYGTLTLQPYASGTSRDLVVTAVG